MCGHGLSFTLISPPHRPEKDASYSHRLAWYSHDDVSNISQEDDPPKIMDDAIDDNDIDRWDKAREWDRLMQYDDNEPGSLEDKRQVWVIWYTWKNQDDKVCEGIDSSSRHDTLNDRSAHTPGWLGRRGLFRGWEGRCLWWVQGSKAVNEAAWGGFSFWWGSSSPSQQQLEWYPSWLLLPRCKHLPMPGPQGSEWLSRSCIAFRTIQGHLSLLSMLTSPKPLE